MDEKSCHQSVKPCCIMIYIYSLSIDYFDYPVQAPVSLKVVSRKRRRKCTKTRVTTVSLINVIRIYDLRSKVSAKLRVMVDTRKS